MKILVTGAGALLGQGIIRSLLDSNLPNLEVIAADPNPQSAGLFWTPNRYILPLASNSDFLTSICELINKTKADLVIPGTDVELKTLSENRDLIEKVYGSKILVSSPEIIKIGDDKYETFKFFRNNGFEPPDSCLPSDIGSFLKRVDFPLIVKPRTGARSIGVRKVWSRQELLDAISMTDNPVIQECVGEDGAEYTAGVISFPGESCASIVMRRDLRDGNTYRAFVDCDQNLNQQVIQFAEKLKPFGPVNFQFRLTDGVIRVFEINSRFSGTTPLRMLAGFNEVEMCIRHMLLGERIVQPKINPIMILRHWSETVVEAGTHMPVNLGE